jgi:hypothetical protein
VSKEGGLLQLLLPPEFVPGSELKISVTYKDLVIHVPLNGDLTVPKDASKVVTVQLGPRGDAPLLANSALQIVAASIRQQDTPSGSRSKSGAQTHPVHPPVGRRLWLQHGAGAGRGAPLG